MVHCKRLEKELKLNGLIIDLEDIYLLETYVYRISNTGYAVRSCGRHDNKLLHRDILNVSDGAIFVDHINRNRLDNRKVNLRIVTRKENRYNSSANSSKAIKWKGVYKKLGNRKKKWEAKITSNNVSYNNGIYLYAEDAAMAYNELALLYQGDKSFLNESEENYV